MNIKVKIDTDILILEYNNETYEVYIDKDDNQLKIANISRM